MVGPPLFIGANPLSPAQKRGGDGSTVAPFSPWQKLPGEKLVVPNLRNGRTGAA